MQDVEHGVPGDDEPVPMTMSERSVWGYLIAVVLTSGAYLVVMATRLADRPVEQVEWVVPMLWTLGASVVGSVLITIVLTIGGTISASVARSVTAARARAEMPAPVRLAEIESTSDARDQDISLLANRAHIGVLAAGFVGALVLAMLDADTFWIGNLLFVVGTVGALVETTTKLRLYRRGF